MLAGFLIGLASFCYCQNDIKQFGMVLFCGGLFTICRYSLSLYTGMVGYVEPMNAFRLLCVLVINVIASFLTGYFFNYGHINDFAYGIVNNFNTMTYMDVFIKSFGCGVCMFLAVDIWKKYNSVIGIMLFVPIFLSCGFLHSIAIPAFYGICGTIPPMFKLLFVAFGNGVGAILVNKIK